MPTNLRESGFEEHIEKFLVEKNAYRKRMPLQYDKERGMDIELLFEFLPRDEW